MYDIKWNVRLTKYERQKNSANELNQIFEAHSVMLIFGLSQTDGSFVFFCAFLQPKNDSYLTTYTKENLNITEQMQ
jgi:hypothetical protein